MRRFARSVLAPAFLLAACDPGAPPPRSATAPPSGLEAANAPGTLPVVPIPPSEPVRIPGRSVFLPHRGAPFDPAKENGIWCATFQLAWDALGRDVVMGPVDLGPPAPTALVTGMNARPFPLGDLDPASFVALAGTKASGILERIAMEGQEKFGVALPRNPLGLSTPQSVLAYAFLREDLPFEEPFETIEGGLPFAGSPEPVRAFGVNEGSEDLRRGRILAQVAVLFEEGDGERRAFALEIPTRGDGDRLILARVEPVEDLGRTWGSVDGRIRRGTRHPLPGDAVLEVPLVHFDLLHEYAEFAGAALRRPGLPDLPVERAFQSLLFRMDERGLEVESEAALLEGEAAVEPVAYRFDRPFLVALRRKDAGEPYLLLWVANTDLMPR